MSLGLTQLQRQPLRACNYPSAGLYRWGCCYSCFIIRSTDGLLSALVFPALCLRTHHKSSWWGWSAVKNSEGPSFSSLVTLYKRPLCLVRSHKKGSKVTTSEHASILHFSIHEMYNYKLYHQYNNGWNWQKVTVKTLIAIQNLYISNKRCFLVLSIHKSIPKKL